jgi:glycosyltransferase involved in cell wall biosynthesis
LTPGLPAASTKSTDLPMRVLQVLQALNPGGIKIEVDSPGEWIEPLETRETLGLSADQIVIGHVGRFVDAKRYRLLLEILVAAHRMNPRCRLLLAGDGPLRAAIEKRAESMDIRKLVVFAGKRFDNARVLQAMDVLAFPSKFTGARAAGIPCVGAMAVQPDSPAQTWAVLILERAAHSRSLSPESPRDASLERLAAIYRTTR